MDSLKKYLEEHTFFAGLTEEDLDLLEGCAKNVRFDEGQQVFREGEDANHFYILRYGKIAIDIFAGAKGKVTVETLSAGEVFGWSWLVPPFQWHFDARAVELTRALALDAKCLREKFEKDNRLGYEMFKRFAKVMMHRLQATQIQLLDIYRV